MYYERNIELLIKELRKWDKQQLAHFGKEGYTKGISQHDLRNIFNDTPQIFPEIKNIERIVFRMREFFIEENRKKIFIKKNPFYEGQKYKPKKTLTKNEFCEIVGINLRTLYRWDQHSIIDDSCKQYPLKESKAFIIDLQGMMIRLTNVRDIQRQQRQQKNE